jgi:hypothetical protein
VSGAQRAALYWVLVCLTGVTTSLLAWEMGWPILAALAPTFVVGITLSAVGISGFPRQKG